MRSNLKRNLLIGFSASLIILIISSVASFLSITNLLSSAEWVNHTNEVIIQLNLINSGMVDAETGQRGYLLTGEKEFLAPYNDSHERVTAAYNQVKFLTSDNQEQQNKFPQLNKLIGERFYYLDQAIEEKKKDQPANLENIRKGSESMGKIRELVHTMIGSEEILLVTRTESLNKFAGYTPLLIVVAALFALIITVSFYARVRADFETRSKLQDELQRKDEETTERIDIIKAIADKISQGNYAIRVDDKQSDALGSVAVSLNKMAEGLEASFEQLSDKEWLQTGLSKLNDLMIGEKTVEILANEVTDLLSTYTNSHAAAMYIFEGDELHLVAGYAFVPDASRKKIKPGEGLVGQAALNKKAIQLTDVPIENIYISYATGQAKPNHIIAIPIIDGYEIKGVVELATMKSFSDRDVEFLTTSSHNIGIAVSTAQNRKKLQELLEETQSQSEELKAQHNELENMNSELEVQAEKLQASEEELRVQQEELQQANIELEERSRLLEEKNQLIAERNVDIQSKAEQLAQSTKYKSEFLANMSHELRTPLNSILLLSRLLSENQEKNLTTDQVEYTKVIQSSGNGLLSLIDEILDLSKIEAGKMSLEYQSVSMRDVVSDMEALFKPVTRDKKIEFRTSIAKEVPSMFESDKLRLGQILRNLLSNAIKFTASGYVSLTIETDKKDTNYIRFLVKDSGIGIAKEKQDLVFEAFQQADGSTRRKYGGTGLGLSISRELARLLGGEIELKSELGEGSEFMMTIPISKSIERAKPIEIEVPIIPTTKTNQQINTLQPIYLKISQTIEKALRRVIR